METRSRDVHPETRKGPNTAPVLAFHKSAGHDWQTVWKDPTRYRRKWSKRTRVQTKAQHISATGPPRWNGDQELRREEANIRVRSRCG